MVEVLVALIGLCGVALGVWASNRNLNARLDKLAEHDRAQYLALLRLTVMSPEMPISERIAAGKEYIDHDGNGDVKHYYEEFLKQHTK